MILALTAAAVTGYRARLTLTVTAPPAGATINLYRDDLSGVLVPVLGGTALPALSTVLDDVPALNRPTWWRASTTGVRTNLCPNPSCELNITGWSLWPGTGGAVTATRETSGGKDGVAFYRGTWTAAAAASTGGTITPLTPVATLTPYTMSVWLRPSATRAFTLSCQFYNGGTPTGAGAGTPVSCPAGVWTQVYVVATSAASDTQVELRAYNTDAAGLPIGFTLDSDACLIEANAPDMIYFNGSIPSTVTVTAITPAPVTVTSDLPVLADPRGGVAVQVTVAEWTETAIEGTATPVQVDVQDTADDATVWILGPDGAHTAKLTLRADDNLATVRQILSSGRPMLLRGSQPGLEDPWLIGLGRRERRVTNRVTDWRRYLVLDVGLPTGAPDPTVPVMGDTLGDLATAVPTTLLAISTTWATLLNIATADLKAM